MEVTERISKIKEYFREMKVATTEEGEYIYVTLVFPGGWILDGRTLDKFNVECTTENGISYFWAPIETGISTVFDAVEYNIKSNKEAQEKVVLFNDMVKQLQDIFSDDENDIEKLKTLTISFPRTENKPIGTTTFQIPSPPKRTPGRPKKVETTDTEEKTDE